MIYASPTSITPVHMELQKIFHNKYGVFEHDEMVGMKFGTKMFSKKGKVRDSFGFVYLLHPSSILWTLSLPHRTQILYTRDISYILAQLDVGFGSRLLESGTGSGSFLHSAVECIAGSSEDQGTGSGHVYSFEFHKTRFDLASSEIHQHLLSSVVTLVHADVYENGFKLTTPESHTLENSTATLLSSPSAQPDIIAADAEEVWYPQEIDAVFLDLPCPWKAIPHALRVLRTNKQSRLCTFSPCIEQVQRNCSALSSHGFTEISTIECLSKYWDVAKEVVVEGNPWECTTNPKKRRFEPSKWQQEDHENSALLSYPSQSEMRGHTSYLTFATYIPNSLIDNE